MYTMCELQCLVNVSVCSMQLVIAFVVSTVPEVIVERPNITVPEGPPEVEICIRLTTGVTEQVIVTAETGPKSGAANQATGRFQATF